MKNLNLVFLLLAALAFGCKLPGSIRDLASGNSPNSNTSRVSTDRDAPNAVSTGGANPKEDVVRASKKFIDLPAFSAKMEGTGQNELRMQVDYAAPDRFHIIYLAGVGAGTEMIMIGNQTYMKAGDKWQKFPAAANSSIPTLRDSFTDEGLRTLSDVKFEGDDAVDGEPALVYSYKNVTPKGNYPFTSKIWVAKETGLPMKINVEYTNGPLKEMNVVYDTESPVSIEPPVN